MPVNDDRRPATQEKQEEWRYAERAMAWHGWGSPVGLGLFVLALAGAVAILRQAFWG